MNHSGITNNCAQCHAAGLTFANITPKEPPATHLPISGLACENCHSTTVFTAFGPGTTMKHTGITGNCASCHETGKTWYGVTMVDRPTAAQDPNHPTTGDCSNCHSSTTSFNTAVAKPSNHIPTSQACTLCHSNSANYAVYTMNHAGITSNCIQCHGTGLSFANIVPKEPPSNHIPTASTACESCHSPAVFTAFSGTKMNHTPVSAMTCESLPRNRRCLVWGADGRPAEGTPHRNRLQGLPRHQQLQQRGSGGGGHRQTRRDHSIGE